MVPERDDEETPEPVITDKTDEVTVEPSEPEDRTPSDKPQETPEERQSRKEFRKNRMREEKERAAAAEAREREANERTARLERELAETRGYVQALGQRDRPDPEAEVRTKVEKLRQEARGHLEAAGLAAKAGDQARADREYAAYVEKSEDAAIERFSARNSGQLDERLQQFRQQQPMVMTPQLLQTRDALNAEFKWLSTNKRALDAVDAEVERRMRAGQPFTYQMARAVAAEVQRDLGLRVTTPPTERQRAAYAAPGGGEAGGGDDGPVRVPMGKAEKIMAHKLYPDMDPVEAEKKWAREVGAPDARKKAKAGR